MFIFIAALIVCTPVAILIGVGKYLDKKRDKEAKVEQELREFEQKQYAFESWWLESKYNKFIVLEKRTPMHFDGKRYFAVRQIETNDCFNVKVDVTTYFDYNVGDTISFSDYTYEYCSQPSLEAFRLETGLSFC